MDKAASCAGTIILSLRPLCLRSSCGTMQLMETFEALAALSFNGQDHDAVLVICSGIQYC